MALIKEWEAKVAKMPVARRRELEQALSKLVKWKFFADEFQGMETVLYILRNAIPDKYELSDADMRMMLDSLDETGGILMKESELRFWIERFVNVDRLSQ